MGAPNCCRMTRWRLCADPTFIPTDGIAVWALRRFVSDNQAFLGGLSTGDVCLQLVKPATRAGMCAYAELLQGSPGDQGRPAVGRANIFLCHAWRNSFEDLVDALETALHDETDAFVWCVAYLRLLSALWRTPSTPSSLSASAAPASACCAWPSMSVSNSLAWVSWNALPPAPSCARIDIMTVNQHNANNCPGTGLTPCHCGTKFAEPTRVWWAGTFKDVIATFGRVASLLAAPRYYEQELVTSGGELKAPYALNAHALRLRVHPIIGFAYYARAGVWWP